MKKQIPFLSEAADKPCVGLGRSKCSLVGLWPDVTPVETGCPPLQHCLYLLMRHSGGVGRQPKEQRRSFHMGIIVYQTQS